LLWKIFGRKRWREIFMVKSFTNCSLRQISLGWSRRGALDEDEYGTHWRYEKYIQNCGQKANGRLYLGDICVHGRIILKWIIQTEYGGVVVFHLARVNCFRQQQWTLCFHRKRGLSRADEGNVSFPRMPLLFSHKLYKNIQM
jgi:hypothetical protein